MELNAYFGGRRHLANVQEKWMHNSGDMPWNRGDPSSDVAIGFLFSSWLRKWNTPFLLQGKRSQFYMDILVIGY